MAPIDEGGSPFAKPTVSSSGTRVECAELTLLFGLEGQILVLSFKQIRELGGIAASCGIRMLPVKVWSRKTVFELSLSCHLVCGLFVPRIIVSL